MNVVLWIIQGLLAVAYLMAGGMKLIQPLDALGTRMDWVRTVPPGLVRFIGAAEVLGAIGLILPMVASILPWLTVGAALGLIIVQLCAAVFHLSRGEAARLPANAVLLLLAAFVVIGRLAIAPVI